MNIGDVEYDRIYLINTGFYFIMLTFNITDQAEAWRLYPSGHVMKNGIII